MIPSLRDSLGAFAPESLCAQESAIAAFVEREIQPQETQHDDATALAWVRAMGEAQVLDPAAQLQVPTICLFREHIAYRSGLADSMFALQGLGYGAIALFGTETQKQHYGTGVRAGTMIAGLGLTEPEAGSDLGSIQTRAVFEDDTVQLTGTKCFISNAGLADFYVVFARTSDDGHRGLSAFIVLKDEVTRTEPYTLIAPHPCGEVHLEHVRIPRTRQLGKTGEGYKIALKTLSHFRPTVGAAALGFANRALDEASVHAKRRTQFGKSIGDFQLVQAHLADSWTELQAARMMVYRAALAHEAGEALAHRHASAAKLMATEAAQRIVDRAVQIFGGLGVKQGSVVERLYRDVRALRIYEGTSEIQRSIIGRDLLKAIDP